MELALVIFLLSGFIKSFLLFFEIDLFLDFTLLTSIFLMLSFVLSKKRINFSINNNQWLAVLALLIFYIWLISTNSYSLSKSYSTEKTLLFSLNILAFVLPLFIKDFSFTKFIRFGLIILFFFTSLYLILYFNYMNDIYVVDSFLMLKGEYLYNALMLGMFSFFLINTKKAIFRSKQIDSLIFVICLVFMVLLGARGPLFSLVIITILMFLFNCFKYPNYKFLNLKKKFKSVNILYLLLLSLISFSVVMYFSNEILNLLNRSMFRMNLILGNISEDASKMGSSVDTRVEQIGLAFQVIFSNMNNFFFGTGIGSFGILELNEDIRAYPHNIFLEIWVELGFFGLLLFFIFLYFILRNMQRRVFLTGFILLYVFMNLMKSNSIVDIRFFFIIFALYISKDNFYPTSTSKKVIAHADNTFHNSSPKE